MSEELKPCPFCGSNEETADIKSFIASAMRRKER